MKKVKILSVLGILLAMGVTACGGKPSEQPSDSGNTPVSEQSSNPASEESSKPSESQHKHSYGQWTTTAEPTCTEAGSKERVCECGDKQVEEIPALGHDFSDGAEKVDVLEEEGSVKEEMYKCKRCTATSVRWNATEYDVAKTTERSTKKPESRGSGKAVRFDSTANYQDADTTKKGCHIVYNVYIPEPATKLNIYMKTSKRTDNTLPPVVNKMEDDNAKGYEYVNGELVRPATRYGLKIDGEIFIVPEDTSGQEWQDGINWYFLPGEHAFETAGIHEIEFYNLGGYRADFYEFALVGFGPHEHVQKFTAIDSRLNSDNKQVLLSEDKFDGTKAIDIAFKDFSDAPANPSGTNPWYMAKGSFATWKINVDKAIEGAKLYFSLECSSDTHLERHLFNEAQWNEAHPDDPVKLPGQSPDTVDEAAWRYSIFVGETEFPILNNKTMGESGVKAKNEQTYVYFGDINLAAGENVVKLQQNNIGYRMKFNQNVRIVYNSDAVIAGEHGHLYNELVSETPATCTEAGSKVMKCLCGETTTIETPALGHDWKVGEADANGVSALTCGREGCTASGLQMHAFDGDNAACLDGSNKMVNGTKVTWAVNMPKAGTYELYLQAKHSANQANQKFGDGYGLSAGSIVEGTYTPSVTGVNNLTTDKAYKDVGLNQNTAEYFLVGSIALTQGDIVIQFQNAGTQGYRLIYENSLRLIFVA